MQLLEYIKPDVSPEYRLVSLNHCGYGDPCILLARDIAAVLEMLRRSGLDDLEPRPEGLSEETLYYLDALNGLHRLASRQKEHKRYRLAYIEAKERISNYEVPNTELAHQALAHFNLVALNMIGDALNYHNGVAPIEEMLNSLVQRMEWRLSFCEPDDQECQF